MTKGQKYKKLIAQHSSPAEKAILTGFTFHAIEQGVRKMNGSYIQDGTNLRALTGQKCLEFMGSCHNGNRRMQIAGFPGIFITDSRNKIITRCPDDR